MKNRSSLGVQLSLAVVVITTSVLAIFGFYRLSDNSDILKSQLEKSLTNTVERLAFSLSSPYFNFHDKGIRDIILSEMDNRAILGIYVVDKQSNALHYGYVRSEGEIKKVKEEKIFEPSLEKEHGITFENLQLGKVRVIMTPLFMEQRLRIILISDISQIIILDVCLVILMIILLRNKIIKPIRKLTQSSSEISAGRLNETIDVHSSDEIGILAGGFAVMRDSIKNQIVVLETENEERKKAEAALKESEEKYRTLVENSPLGIAVIDKQHNYIYLSSNFIKIFGYTLDDFSTGKEWFKLAFPDKDNREQVIERWIDDKNIAKSGDSRPRTFDVVCKDGNVKTIDFKPTTLETGEQIVMYEDITERKQSEELLIQTEKMMSVGGLAAGMAHELNNPLGGMLQGAQNIQRRLSPDLEKNVQSATTHGINLNNLQNYLKERKILDYLVGINESGQRAAKIIKDMLLFSRKSESTMAPTNLLEIMENVLDLAGKNYDLKKKYDFRSIDIIREFEPNLPLISCTATEIEQVVLNLLSNAAWAMANEKRNTPPQITLRVKIEKQMARIDIEDNGPGIDEDIKKRIFEPFFTTKPLGEGTGLGLSVSYMIITNNHRGTMEVESEIGKGTNFIIKLPLDKIGS
ncbi:MAG: PAS domain S-box protein [Deltaproteobacteria bacterium]|nr:PAS domain S-box protein [Deltaproteobacteria bacterium]MBT6612354.1 PAS domain S-box protein [Deltaproteobacteria bacterium]